MRARRFRPIDYLIEFVPHRGYAWMVIEQGVVLADGIEDTEHSAREACRRKFEDFGMEFPD